MGTNNKMDIDIKKEMTKQAEQKVNDAITGIRIINFYRFLWNKGLTGSICIYKSEYGLFSAWALNKGKVIQTSQQAFEGHGATIDEALNSITKEFAKHGIV